MSELIKRSEISVTSKGLSFKNVVYRLQTQTELGLSNTGGCEGCGFKTGYGLGCSLYSTNVEGAGHNTALHLANSLTDGCWYRDPTFRKGYVYVQVPEEIIEPGENGYVPDTFLPGEDIHAVTKILCK